MTKAHVILNCQDANLQHSGGVGRYAAKLVTGLPSREASDFSFEARDYVQADLKKSLSSPLNTAKSFVKNALPPPALAFVKHQIHLLKWNRREASVNPSFPEGPILVHEISNYRYLSTIGTLLPRSNFRYVASFLDIQDYFFPEFFSAEELSFRRVMYAFLKEYGYSFIAISEFTKQSMIKHLGIAPEKIKVIYLGSDIASNGEIPPLKPIYQDLGSYFIYPAKPWAHKNHQFLLESVSRMKNLYRERKHKVVLTGGFSPSDTKKIESSCQNLGISDLVVVLGFLSDDEVKSLVGNAKAMIFPSLFEGFGMPVVEAQALGTPVISSHAASLKEICLDTAATFDPTDPSSIDHHVEIALQTSFDRHYWSERGLENIKRFTWDNCLNETVATYKEALLGI